MTRQPITGLAIYPDKRIEEVELSGLEDFQAIVDGWIEPVNLRFGTLYVNEEFFLRQFGPEDFNSIASDVAGIGGNLGLMLTGILGPAVLVGGLDREGYDESVTDAGRKAVERAARGLYDFITMFVLMAAAFAPLIIGALQWS